MDGFMIAVVALALVASALMAYFRRNAWRETLTRVMSLYPGLDLAPQGTLKAPMLIGDADGFPVTLDTYTVRHGKSSTTYTRVSVDTGLPAEMTLSREGLGSFISKAFVGEDVEIGEPAFDTEVVLRGGDPAELAAYLDAETRGALRAVLMAHRTKLDAGTLSLSVSGRAKVEAIEEMLEAALDVARAVRRNAGTVPERLERIAFVDPTAGVRRRAFDYLLGHVSRSEALRLARRALESGDPGLVVAGAELLRDAPAVAALHALVAEATEGAALARGLALLAALGHPPRVEVALRHVYARVDGVREGAARCLAAIGDERAQNGLLALLADGEQAVAVAAAEGLGHCGGIAVVEPLLEHTKGFGKADLKRAAKDAIAAIQERAVGEAGGLSLVDDVGGGGLSLAPEAAGGEVRVASPSGEEER